MGQTMAHVEDRWLKDKVKTARYGRGLRYRVRYADPDGRERSKSFADGEKRKADQFAAAAEADVRRGIWTDPAAGRMTLRRFAEDTYLPALTSDPSTRERIASQLRLHILPALGGKTLGQLAAHPSITQQWVRGLPLAPSSAGVMLATLSGVLSAALDDGLIQRNPCSLKSVRAPKAERRRVVPWARERVAAVRAELAARYRALADCGSGLGLRQGEAFGLAPDDVDWLRGVVHVRRQVKIVAGRPVFGPPKGGKERDVPLPEVIKLRLSAHVRDCPARKVTLPWQTPGGPLTTVALMFTSGRGGALQRGAWNKAHWRPALRRIGITPPTRAARASQEDTGFHQLRHAYASTLLHAGVDVVSVAAWMGDTTQTVLSYCAHLMPDADVRGRKAVDGAFADEDHGPDAAQSGGDQA